MKRSIVAAAAAVIFPTMTFASELKVLSTQATEDTYRELVPEFEIVVTNWSAGNNLLAAEVHQNGAASGDVGPLQHERRTGLLLPATDPDPRGRFALHRYRGGGA